MDTVMFAAAAGAYVAAELTRGTINKVIHVAFDKVVRHLANIRGPTMDIGRLANVPSDSAVADLGKPELAADPVVKDFTHSVFNHSSALRRAQFVKAAVKDARILWVDDVPTNNRYECQMLAALGARVDQVRSTAEGLASVARQRYDLLLSDIDREGDSKAGVQMLHQLPPGAPPVVFYVGRVDESRGTPRGAFGIADLPETLLHLVLDVLERQRVEIYTQPVNQQ